MRSIRTFHSTSRRRHVSDAGAFDGRRSPPHSAICTTKGYLNAGHPGLKHQRQQKNKTGEIADWYQRGTTTVSLLEAVGRQIEKVIDEIMDADIFL